MSNETILVVDDNRQIANFLAGNVLPSLGYETLVAYDAPSAMEIVHNYHQYIHLVLMDLQLPDTTGLDLLRQFTNEGYNIPTILVTAHGSEQIAVDAFRLGVQDYLNKPVEVDALNEAITRALEESRLRREKNRLNAQLKEQVSWLTVLAGIGRSLSSTLDPDEVLRRIVEAGVHLTKAEEGFLALLDDPGGQLYMRAVKNMDQTKIKTMRIPVSDTLVGQVLTSGKALRTSRAGDGPPLKVSTGLLVHSVMHVPLISKGKAIGVLSVDNQNSRDSFTSIDEAMLMSLADYASAAIENASLYERARQEIAERKRVESALRESEERYALAVRGANDGLWDWDLKTNQIYYSPRWKSMLGFNEEDIQTSPDEWFKRVHPEDIYRLKMDLAAHIKSQTTHFESEHRMLHKDGSYRWILSRGIAVWDSNGTANRMAGSQSDITDRKIAEQQLIHDAFHDTLTNLPNRALFMDRLRHAVERAKRRDEFLFAVLFLDLDRFKDINDSLGHMVGDQLLIAVGNMLATMLRPADTVARLGGDEFVILLEDIRHASDATRVADRIQGELVSASLLSDHSVFVTASIGIVLSQSGYNDPEDVLRDADIAMYRAKGHGKARYEIFDTTMRERIVERLRLEAELRRAIENKELCVYYQPIVALEDGEMISLEALVRWQHPTRGMIPPIEFVPLAEETGLIISIDRWVLQEACRQLCDWQKVLPDGEKLTLSANISVKQIAQPDFTTFIEKVLRESQILPNSLRLEITESALMENFESTVEIFAYLKTLGVQLQIDDFGVGYSSLNYLSQFPLNALKIDRSFVKMMAEEESYLKIVQAIVGLAHGLGMRVIAEGVETEMQFTQLKDLGCEFVQGYLIARPMPADSVLDLVNRSKEGGIRMYPEIKTA